MSKPLSGNPLRLGELGDDPVVWAPSLVFLKVTTTFILAGGVCVEIATFLLAPEQTTRALTVLILAIVAGAAWIFLALGRVKAAILILSIGVWSYVTFASFFFGGVSGTAIIIYPLIILLTGWLVSTRVAMGVAWLTVVVTLGFVLGET